MVRLLVSSPPRRTNSEFEGFIESDTFFFVNRKSMKEKSKLGEKGCCSILKGFECAFANVAGF